MDQPDARGCLRQRLADLLAVAQAVTGKVRFQDDDDLALMAVCFLSKQIGHAESVLLLDESTDVVLVARTMLEGACQLRWAAQEPALRAKRWRDFVWVHDSRAVRTRLAQHETIDSAGVQTVEEGLRDVREMFFTKRAARAARNGSSLPDDPFHANWTGIAIDQIFAEIGASDRYLIYKSFSDWQHWSVGGIGRSLPESPDGVNYVAHEPDWNLAAVVLAFECLWHTLQVVNHHLQLGLAEQLQLMHDRWFQEAQAVLADLEPERPNHCES